MNEDVKRLSERLEQIERRFTELTSRCEAAERSARHERRRGRVITLSALGVLGASMLLSPTTRSAIAQSTDAAASLAQRVARLEHKTSAMFMVASPDASGASEVEFRGVNVRVSNGLGSTNSTNGTGNLIIGYNEFRGGNTDIRFGSHNLIIGELGNYWNYGSIVAGYDNESAQPFASVLGGEANIANAENGVIVGGEVNSVVGSNACVLGGSGNRADAMNSVVCGGDSNLADGYSSSVLGGSGNTVNNTSVEGSIAGGRFNVVTSYYGTVSGGNHNYANGEFASVSGGYAGTANGTSSSVSGGYIITQNNGNGWSGGGYHSP